MKHALVTGSSGFIGRVLVEKLIARGYAVTGVDVIPGTIANYQYTQIHGDIRDQRILDTAMSGVDVVFHNAASVPLEMEGSQGRENNEEMCSAVLRAAKAFGVQKVVFVSSSAVFGKPDKLPVTESTLLEPFEPYGRAKQICEEQCHFWVSEGLDVTIIRPRTVLGGGRLGLMGALFDLVRSGAPVPVVLGKGGRYQLIHVEDLVWGLILSGERPGAAVYNLGADDLEPMEDLLRRFILSVSSRSMILRINKKVFVISLTILNKLKFVPFTKYQIQMFCEDMWFDTTKAKRELGWSPRWTGLEMLQDSYSKYLLIDSSLSDHKSVHSRPIRSRLLRMVITVSRRSK